jgi:DNA-binding LytR/AlgR family response regulator
MRIFIAEDEPPARDRLIETIGRVAADAVVVATAASVQAAREWLATNPAPDLLLLDIQLSDGLSLELFQSGAVQSPAIFATAYDEFVMQAFRANAVDYLLKPIGDIALARAFANYRRLKTHFSADLASLLERLQAGASPRRERLLTRRGGAFASLRVKDVAYFVCADKLVFAVDNAGARHLLDVSLAELEAELDPQTHFRINRQFIVAADAIEGFAPAGRGRLALRLRPAVREAVAVTQERAAQFRQWLSR